MMMKRLCLRGGWVQLGWLSLMKAICGRLLFTTKEVYSRVQGIWGKGMLTAATDDVDDDDTG